MTRGLVSGSSCWKKMRNTYQNKYIINVLGSRLIIALLSFLRSLLGVAWENMEVEASSGNTAKGKSSRDLRVTVSIENCRFAAGLR
jgi:hypothetical protein